MTSTKPLASSIAVRDVMRANRGRDTGPELRVRRAVHALGLRYRVAIRPLPTLRRTADLVFTRAQVAVFVDGCFWHGCPEHYRPARINAAFWADKISATQRRDYETDNALHDAGWAVVRVWEHDGPVEAASRVQRVVRARRAAQSAVRVP